MHNYDNTHASLHRGIFINTETVKFALESCVQIVFLLEFVLDFVFFPYCNNI